jgi:hypothetical protein
MPLIAAVGNTTQGNREKDYIAVIACDYLNAAVMLMFLHEKSPSLGMSMSGT